MDDEWLVSILGLCRGGALIVKFALNPKVHYMHNLF